VPALSVANISFLMGGAVVWSVMQVLLHLRENFRKAAPAANRAGRGGIWRVALGVANFHNWRSVQSVDRAEPSSIAKLPPRGPEFGHRPNSRRAKRNCSGKATVAGISSTAVMFSLMVSGCTGTRQPLNPPRLIMDAETDMAIQLFMQSTILMARYYGFSTIAYSTIQEKSVRAGFRSLPFMPPDTVRATPPLVNNGNSFNVGLLDDDDSAKFRQWVDTKFGYDAMVRYYIKTGWKASQLICRNYLLGLEEQNRYLEFLRSEFGVASTLASGILSAVNANATLSNAFLLGTAAVNGAITNYEEYRFLKIDRDSARILVEAAQNKYVEYFMKEIDPSTRKSQVPGKYTFSEALSAVSVIEYQCTREGITHLLNRSINNSPTNLDVDENTGTVMFRSTKNLAEASSDPAASKSRVPGETNRRKSDVVTPIGGAVSSGTSSAGGSGSKSESKVTGGQTDVERKLAVFSGQQIQSNLCVSVADGNFGMETREAIRQAKLAANMSRIAKRTPSLFSPVNSQIGTNDEAQIFLDARHCAIDRSGMDRAYATAFEKFGFPDEIAIKDLQKALAKCDPSVRLTGIFDKATRDGISAATSMTSSTVSRTNRLNDKSYEWVSGVCI